MLIEASTDDIEEAIQGLAIDHLHSQDQYPDHYAKGVTLELGSDALREIILQLVSLGLIEESERRHQISDTNQYWQLTPEGRAHLVRLRAVRASSEAEEPSDSGAEQKVGTTGSARRKTTRKKATAKKKAAAKRSPSTKAAREKPDSSSRGV